MKESALFVIEAKKLGVQGFVSKDRAGAVLLAAVDALLRKETYFVGLGTVT
jgi:DNA-binding NarL/FixJ family response regulator